MHNIDWYLDTARARLGLKSDHELALWLGRSRNACTMWRTRRHWPNGKVMVKLAAACDVPTGVALAELGSWREPEVLEWQAVAAQLARVAPAIIMALVFFFGDGDGGAQARTPVEHPATTAPPPIHYATFWRRRAQCAMSALRWKWASYKAFFTSRHNAAEIIFA